MTNWNCSAVKWRWWQRVVDNTRLPAPNTVNQHIQASSDAFLLLSIPKPHQTSWTRSACATDGRELSLAGAGVGSTADHLWGGDLVLHHQGSTADTAQCKHTDTPLMACEGSIMLAISLRVHWTFSHLAVKQNEIAIPCWDNCPHSYHTQDNFIPLIYGGP